MSGVSGRDDTMRGESGVEWGEMGRNGGQVGLSAMEKMAKLNGDEDEVYSFESPHLTGSFLSSIPALFSSFARPPELSVNAELPFPAQFRVHLALRLL
jgi:hypothetical protein